MQKLTKTEEEIMLVLWDLQKAFVKDIIEQLPEPKPHYNTVSTMIKILQDKKFVGYEAFGKSYRYFPLIPKQQYGSTSIKKMLSGYFNGSAQQLVSFFVKENKISLEDLEQLVQDLKTERKSATRKKN
jgi:predicted transcriptional regulator